ncbi:hypothetical protein ACFFRR_005810 [Megaselia abdita]
MTDLANIQSNLLTQLGADSAYLDELIEAETSLSQALLTSLQKELESLMSQARSNHSQLINSKKPSDTVVKYLTDDIVTQIRRKFHTYWAKIEEKILKEPKPEFNAHDTTMGGSRSFKIKLPTLSIPRFAGDIRKWKTFHNSFISLVEENQNLTLIDKFRLG